MLAGWQPRFGASPHPFLQWSGNLSTISQASQTPVTLGKVPTPPAGTLVTQRSNGHPDGWMDVPSWFLAAQLFLWFGGCPLPPPSLSVAHAPQAPWT